MVHARMGWVSLMVGLAMVLASAGRGDSEAMRMHALAAQRMLADDQLLNRDERDLVERIRQVVRDVLGDEGGPGRR